jgi:hypothetical protein
LAERKPCTSRCRQATDDSKAEKATINRQKEDIGAELARVWDDVRWEDKQAFEQEGNGSLLLLAVSPRARNVACRRAWAVVCRILG